MLDNLNVSSDEFFFIKNDLKKEQYLEYMIDIRKAYEMKDKRQLLVIKENCCVYEKRDQIKFIHLSMLIDLLVNKLDNVPSSKKNGLVMYLVKIETWTKYEMVLFNNCMYAFDESMIDLIAKKITLKLSLYENFQNYGNEAFRLLTNVYMYFLERKNFSKLIVIMKSLEEQRLTEDCLYEKNTLLFIKGIHQMILGNKVEGTDKIEKALEIFEVLEAKRACYMFNKLYQFVLEIC